jgi:hypothetical protein
MAGVLILRGPIAVVVETPYLSLALVRKVAERLSVVPVPSPQKILSCRVFPCWIAATTEALRQFAETRALGLRLC